MRRGDFERAWEASDAALAADRGAMHDLPRHLRAVWDGTPLDGRRVLVRCHHGLGDTLQFVRYLPLVERRARSVSVLAQPALLPLLRTMGGAACLLPLDDAPDPPHDVDVEVMELPHVFRTSLATLPADVPYLHVPAAPRPDRAPDGLAVGIVWRVGDWAPHRAIPLARLAPLADVPGVTLHVLQRGDGLAERSGALARLGTLAPADDVPEMARTMRALDLVITVDSMPAHLAGALGVPVWTLLPADADWRWMEGRDDSPWYPTMRLFRQERPGDWAPVVARVADALRRLREPRR